MKLGAAAIIGMALAGCASALIERTGDYEYAIGESGRDNFRTNSSLAEQHRQRASAVCRGVGGRLELFDIPPPDTRFHFRCVMLPPPAPPPPPPIPPPPPPPPVFSTEAEITATREAWRQCLEAAEPAIDDMISDGNTVATVLATRCAPYFDAFVATSRRGFNWPMRDGIYDGYKHGVALDIVLRVRAKRRSPNAPPPPVNIPKLRPGSV